MGRVVIFGSGFAISEEGHENTHLFIEEGDHKILVDCPSSPLMKLKKIGIGFDQVTDLFLTHFHADHVSGVPPFLVESWLMGRKHPLHIYGLPHTLDRTEAMMALYDWKKWPNFYPVIFHRLSETTMSLAIGSQWLKLYTSPVKHLIPTVGLRIEFLKSEKVLAYSCDTEPCQEVVELAYHANGLIHEATGASVGHSSSAQAALIARQSEVSILYLIHYSPRKEEQPGLLNEARKIFSGEVTLAVDGMELNF